MIVLIDADSMVWSCSYDCETKEDAYYKFDEHIQFIVNEIQDQYNIDKVMVFHGQEGRNWRKDVDPEYKANRKSANRPEHYYSLSKYVKTAYEAISAKGEEVDDLVANTWKAYKLSGKDVMIVSIDKDYEQLPCLLYNYSRKKRGFYEFTEDAAQHNLFKQMLTGDRADNVKGIPGIGPVKAERILSPCESRIDYWRCIISTYKEFYGENGLNEPRQQYTLLKLG